MKHSLLYCLAATALTLSFCFERTPAASPTPRATAPAVAEASLLSGLLLPTLPAATPPLATPADPATPATPALPSAAAVAAIRDSLRYGYLGQTLGLRLDHHENPELLQTVTDWIGTPYSFGSNSRRGTDCSGFVSQVFKAVYGIKLQRSAHSMFGSNVQRVARAEMHTGDLVFFRHRGGAIFHVGIYLKDGRFAHSACGRGVMVSSLHEGYYARNFYAGGRVAAAALADAPATEGLLATAP